MSETSLNSLKPGERGTVIRMVAQNPKVRQRLLEMGLIRGTSVEVIRFAPMGNPMEISIKGYRLSLRREEAESVIVTRTSK